MYSAEILYFIKMQITLIIKSEFFLAFKAAFCWTFTKENVLGGFCRAGLLPYNSQAVLSKLDVKLQMLTLSRTPDRLPTP